MTTLLPTFLALRCVPAAIMRFLTSFFGFLARVVERGTFFGPMDAEPVMAESEAKQAQEPDTAAEGDEAVDAEAKELVFLKKVTLSARHARWSGLILNGMLAARWRCRLRAW